MPTIHYLNVKNGDCSIIQHNSGRVSVIDVNNAKPYEKFDTDTGTFAFSGENQKEFPVNPIAYMHARSINSVFRFILTHPDMDHMDGISDFFNHFSPGNFWDTNNTKPEPDFSSGHFNEIDWDFYKSLRDDNYGSPKRLTLLNGSTGAFFNRSSEGGSGGDGIAILAPTQQLVDYANENETWNDISYVLLYRTANRKILFGGDADNETWNWLMANHEDDISNVDLLIAPHHGRKSSCSYEFLEMVNPTLTFFGNADKASHLAHDMFNNLGLRRITNNQGNCLIADIDKNGIHIYVTHEDFARERNPETQHNNSLKAYYLETI